MTPRTTRKGEPLKPLFGWRGAICESDLAPATRHVALTMSLHASERGDSCFPGTSCLATETGYSRRTVITHLDILEDKGWLICLDPGGGRGKVAGWQLVVPERVQESDPLARCESDAQNPAENEKGCNPGSQGVQLTHERVQLTQDTKEKDVLGRTQRTYSSAATPLKAEVVAANGHHPNQSAAKPTDDPVKRHAHSLAVLAFEQEVKPLIRSDGDEFAAVMRICEAALRSGRIVADIRSAIEGGYVDVWTKAGLATAAAKLKADRTRSHTRPLSPGDRGLAFIAERRKRDGRE